MSDLIIHSKMPFNAEPPLGRLCATFITPQSDLYIRSHGDVPTLSEDLCRLRVLGRVEHMLDLSMCDLRTGFQQRTLTAVMQCAGNRRADLHRLRPVTGDPWAAGAIGNVSWTGIALTDVLRAANAETNPDLHVVFESYDKGADERPFSVSIPMTKALCADVLLSFEMNGESLTPEHGFPLRIVVPGFAGIRSAKWLAKITVQDTESTNPLQQTDYKMLPPNMTSDSVDWTKGITINEMPLNSAICKPEAGAILSAGVVVLSGYATASGRSVERVDISADEGKNWVQATLEQNRGMPWSWTLWLAHIELNPGRYDLVVRAWDSAGQTQPSHAKDEWNFKGYLCSAWHRISITVT